MTLPWSMISMRGQSRSMSARSWVVSRIVVPRSALMSARKSRTRSLAHDVEADGRLVEEHDLRIVQQRRGEIAPHALPERQLADGRVQEPAEVEQFDEGSQVGAVARLRARGRRAAAARTSRAGAGPTTAGCAGRTPRRSAAPARPASAGGRRRRREPSAARHEDPGEHLDGRGLPCPVRADVADHRSRGHRERHAGDRVHVGPLAPQATGPSHDRERLLDAVDLDDARHRVSFPCSGSDGSRAARTRWPPWPSPARPAAMRTASRGKARCSGLSSTYSDGK